MNCFKPRKDFCFLKNENSADIRIKTNFSAIDYDYKMVIYYDGKECGTIAVGDGITLSDDSIFINSEKIKTVIGYLNACNYELFRVVSGKEIIILTGGISVLENAKNCANCSDSINLVFKEENINLNVSEVYLNGGSGSGQRGLSAYEVAVKNGFTGTETEWLLSLKGEDGDKGDKGEPFTFQDLTEAQVLLLKGADGADGVDGVDGADGADGADGLSAFELWLQNGNNGTFNEFLASQLNGRTVKKLNSDFINSTVTLNEVTDLTFQVVAGKQYWFKLLGTAQTVAATTGFRFYFWCDGSINFLGYLDTIITHGNSNTGTRLTPTVIDATPTAGVITTGVGAVNTPVSIDAEAIINCITSGTFKIRFASEIANSQAQLNKYTTIILEEI